MSAPTTKSAKQANASKETTGIMGAAPIDESKGSGTYGATTSNETEEILTARGLSDQYDLETLTTWKVFGVLEGTILNETNLWKETAVLAVVFWSLFGTVWYCRPEGYEEIIGKESAIRAFIAMFSTLIGLLLSFYTALSLGRWWQMRLQAEAIQEAAKTLTILVSQGVTGDKVLLNSIHRYARASLFLIFAAAQDKTDEASPLTKALQQGLLTHEETEMLRKMNPYMTFVQAETLWVWLAAAVSRLQQEGLTAGAPHYCALMAACDKGRSGVATVQTYLETPIPMGYVHLLCVMVKLHNFLLTVLLALASVMHTGGTHFHPVDVFRTAFRAFFMPFLYNAILILNANVTDPFGADADDFDWNNLDINMARSAKSFIMVSENLPPWLTADKKFKPVSYSQV